MFPSTACLIQHKLGATRAWGFDLSAACSAFTYSLTTASQIVASGGHEHALVVGADGMSSIIDYRDRATCVLFGDGAGAALLVPHEGDDRGILSTHIFADGAGMPFLNIPGGGSAEPTSAKTVENKRHFVKMQGKPVFTHAVKNISSAAKTALEANGKTAADVDWVVAHQANLRILEGVAERVGVPIDKFYLNIHKYGNTSSASIPIALDEAAREGKVKPGDLLLMAALGAGLSWGSALVRF
jgi:3-oxoacyl-[acyl-carrier-protein] synthase III